MAILVRVEYQCNQCGVSICTSPNAVPIRQEMPGSIALQLGPMPPGWFRAQNGQCFCQVHVPKLVQAVRNMPLDLTRH